MPHDLVSAAQDLVGDGRGAPRQANLRRAISTPIGEQFQRGAKAGEVARPSRDKCWR